MQWLHALVGHETYFVVTFSYVTLYSYCTEIYTPGDVYTGNWGGNEQQVSVIEVSKQESFARQVSWEQWGLLLCYTSVATGGEYNY